MTRKLANALAVVLAILIASPHLGNAQGRGGGWHGGGWGWRGGGWGWGPGWGWWG